MTTKTEEKDHTTARKVATEMFATALKELQSLTELTQEVQKALTDRLEPGKLDGLAFPIAWIGMMEEKLHNIRTDISRGNGAALVRSTQTHMI